MRSHLRSSVSLLPLLATTCVALGQDGASSPRIDGTRFGRAVAVATDVDGDGVQDFLVGAPAAQLRSGRVLLVSGATRDVLAVWEGERGRFTFGHTLQDAGDVDGDGTRDVLVGYERGLRTEVRSGEDGAVLSVFDLSSAHVHRFGDVDGDGRDELLLAGERHLELRRAVDGAFVAGDAAPGAGPGSLVSVDDLNGDGLWDGIWTGEEPCLVQSRGVERGWMDDTFVTTTSVPSVWGKALAPFAGWRWLRVSPAGDCDGDGRGEVLLTLGRPATGPAGSVDAARHLLLSPARDSNALWSIETGLPMAGGAEECFGYALALPGDLDGDGAPDLVLAEGLELMRNVVLAYSPRTGERLWERAMPCLPTATGVAMVAAGDHDGDGVRDVFVGSSHWQWTGFVYGGNSVTLISGRSGQVLWTVDESRYRDVLQPKAKGS